MGNNEDDVLNVILAAQNFKRENNKRFFSSRGSQEKSLKDKTVTLRYAPSSVEEMGKVERGLSNCNRGELYGGGGGI
ncbi:MAG: hypothetical protein RBR86_05040 [Pseudobdellovibrionaceae bacterium]|nr:hypothetical protein [Pseudobdellovibrionaceae bacterium]